MRFSSRTIVKDKMNIRLKSDTINRLALLLAPGSKNNPYYLNSDELVSFFNRYGHQDWYDFVDGKGICTPDIGEGLSRMEYVRKRLEEYNKSSNVLEVVKRYIFLFIDNDGLLEQVNDILNDNSPQVKAFKTGEGKINTELINDLEYKKNRSIKLFISYSHDDDEHMAWVKQFVEDLRAEGFEVSYDQDNSLGASWTRFMNRGIAKNEKVLVIGTPEYCKRSKKASGGTAYETTIINIKLLENLDTDKFVTILRKGTYKKSFPILVSDRNGVDFSDDAKYGEKMRELITKLNQSNRTK